MPPNTQIDTPDAPPDNVRGRAIQLSSFLYRRLPFWGHPGWLEGTRWRQLVRNQPIAVVCRDTLIQNVLSNPYDIRPRNPSDATEEVDKARTYYMDLFQYAEGDFDTYCELISQDILDLPFGAGIEVIRENDEKDGAILALEHIDGVTLYPTGNLDFPVRQFVPEYPGAIINFPQHAIERIYLTPRPEIRRKYWGMAPPEKIYLAMEMLYRGDRYYANLLLDTPEAGILDLMDMSRDSAQAWLDDFRAMFFGIDGFKVPVLYEHETPANWIPLNRPPVDMIYDKTTLKYAQIVAAGYGLRLSDIGLSDPDGGGKTLAGVIREERQTRRSGYAMLKEKLKNHLNRLLPKELEFIWIDQDDEKVVARGRAIQTFAQGLKTAQDAGLIDQAEGREQFVAEGLMTIELDPKKLPEKPNPMGGGFPFQGQPGQLPPGAGPGAGPGGNGPVPPSQGGRGNPSQPAGFLQRFFTGRQDIDPQERSPIPRSREDLLAGFSKVIEPALGGITERAKADPIRLRRLIRTTTRAMVPQVSRAFRRMDQDQVERFWLPQMHLHTFDMPNEIDSLVVRQDAEEIRRLLEEQLREDPWWRLLDLLDQLDILDFLVDAYMLGAEEEAVEIVRALYEEGLRATPDLPLGIDFTLTNRATLSILDETAAQLVRRIDSGTEYFMKRVIISGVRQGLASPTIADALRKGAMAEEILARDDFTSEVINNILEGMIELTKNRANSIVNTEIARAENLGRLKQMKESGFSRKHWVHLGERGITEAGNEHPCPVCRGNEDLGFVDIDFQYETVFTPRTGERQEVPPGHPQVCHCTVLFDEQELPKLVAQGEYTPWDGS